MCNKNLRSVSDLPCDCCQIIFPDLPFSSQCFISVWTHLAELFEFLLIGSYYIREIFRSIMNKNILFNIFLKTKCSVDLVPFTAGTFNQH